MMSTSGLIVPHKLWQGCLTNKCYPCWLGIKIARMASPKGIANLAWDLIDAGGGMRSEWPLSPGENI